MSESSHNHGSLLPPGVLDSLINSSFIASQTDAKGIIRYVNDLFCEVSEYKRDELIGRPHRIVKSGLHSREYFRSMWNTIQSGEVWHGEICNRAKSGKLYWVDSFVMPFTAEDGSRCYYSIRYDITRLKQVEQTVENQDVLIDIKRKRLGQIAFLLAHEMRPPIANLLGIVDALEHDDLTPEQRARFHAAIRTEAQRSDELLRKMMQSAVVTDAIDGAEPPWSSGK